MKLYQVDAFTTPRPFSGNPAAVVPTDRPLPEEWMRGAAAEMNLSETAFLHPAEAPGHFHLRWFTPTVEVDLCGHATLASAHVLYETGTVAHDAPITFHTRSGELHCSLRAGRIAMDFPAIKGSYVPVPGDVLLPNKKRPLIALKAGKWVLLEVDGEESLRSVTPESRVVAGANIEAVIVTCQGSGEFDFLSRFFAPNLGVPEDPVTGSAHCVLAPYWSKRLGKTELRGYQASERGGIVDVVHKDTRVELLGEARTVFRGEWAECVLPE